MSKQSDAQLQAIETPRGHGKATLIPNMAAIVRELAESDPWHANNDEPLWCMHCERDQGRTHADTCLWLRARKLMGIS